MNNTEINVRNSSSEKGGVFGMKRDRDRENSRPRAKVEVSPEISGLLENLPNLQLAPGVPQHLAATLEHMKAAIASTLERIQASGRDIRIMGPDWCREHAREAGQAHAQIIVKTYGQTYALPNKNPQANREALMSGELDMFLMFDTELNEPIGTACLVKNGNGWGELGRAASLGHVGNQLIQDLRIVRWLTDETIASQFHSLFTTLRTAPDRDIGEETPMRGGQAVSNIWSKIPETRVAGFGTLYKKHEALEQFSFAFLTQKNISMPETLWIDQEEDRAFVETWTLANRINRLNHEETARNDGRLLATIDFPPEASGITKLVHGDIHLHKDGTLPLEKAIQDLTAAGVPFMQCPVSIEEDTRSLQRVLVRAGFQAFQVTPRIEGVQPAQLWFGKINGNIPVVPTFWNFDQGAKNPFWSDDLANHAERIANGWMR
jgi:hypothetical protein